MLSLFPELLFLTPFAPLVLRVALAVLLAYDGWHTISRPGFSARFAGISSFVIAALLIAGAWTQPIALLFVIGYTVYLFRPYGPTSVLPRSTIALAIAMALTLVVTGPGVFSFDLPL